MHDLASVENNTPLPNGARHPGINYPWHSGGGNSKSYVMMPVKVDALYCMHGVTCVLQGGYRDYLVVDYPTEKNAHIFWDTVEQVWRLGMDIHAMLQRFNVPSVAFRLERTRSWTFGA